jgi:sterol desaturase/sphingolipid hydroxylase (fatty acid hydroxylase superfamily)
LLLHLQNAATVAVGLLFIGVLFFVLSKALLKPGPDPKRLLNLSYAAKPVAFNQDFRIEIFYPFLDWFVTKPTVILITNWIVSAGLGSLPNRPFADTVQAWPIWVQTLVALVVLDLSVYVRHRFVHEFFWPFHAVHHSAREITWLTSKRLHPFDEFVMLTMDFVVLYFLGFSGEGMAAATTIKFFNNLFIHTNIVLDYPKPLKWILVSPNMHRWHHATEKVAHNKNYCVVLAFFDLAFGTYYVPDRQLPASYGTGDPVLDNLEQKNFLKELARPFVMVWKSALGKPQAVGDRR